MAHDTRGRALVGRALVGRAQTLGVAWLRRSRAAAIVLGTTGYVASMSPSLLPRSVVMQGVVSGVSLAAWFGVGVLVDRAWGAFKRWTGLTIEMTHRWPRRILGTTWALGITALLLLAPFAFLDDHQHLAREMGMPGLTVLDLMLAIAIAIATFTALIMLWHGIRLLVAWIIRRLHRWPTALAAPLASVLVALLVFGTVQYVIVGGMLRVVGERSAEVNVTSPPGALPPESALLSGGPGSTQEWDSLGYEGKAFVSGATTSQQIEAATGVVGMQPIRVYAGRSVGQSIDETVAAVVSELDRTDGWDRDVLVLFTTTGQGWVNNWSASAVEYLTGGDSALAAIQHSVLPSPLALLDAPNRPREAGRALTVAVLERVATLPPDQRPEVYVSGESLGAYGGNAAFDSLDELLAKTDGALWSGTPSFTALHREITASRVAGSTEANPVVDNGAHVRFASSVRELSADQFGRALGPWETPRVLYLQHPSDPIVWWSPSLLVRTPDWLQETRVSGPAVNMSWLPVVTFWQVTADMPGATDVPTGLGHNYHDEVVASWAAVLDRGTPEEVDAILADIRERSATWE